MFCQAEAAHLPEKFGGAMNSSTFALVADDTDNGQAPTIHVIVWREAEEVWSWNVACCGESLDDYALVSFENTTGGYPLSMVCGRCFEALGADLLAKRA